MCSLFATSAGDNRRLERLSGQHPPSISGEGQAHQGSWASWFAYLAAVAHWHGHQAHQEQAGGPDHATDGPWGGGASRETTPGLARGPGHKSGFFRTLSCHLYTP